MIRLTLLGSIDLRDASGTPVDAVLSRKKLVAFLAFVAQEGRSRMVRRDRVMALLWPESDEGHARASVRQSMHRLRAALGEPAVLSRGVDEVGINPALVACDTHEFLAHAAAGRLGTAARAYGGEFLAGFHLADSSEFDEWLEAERRSLSREYGRVLAGLVDAAMASSDYPAVRHWLELQVQHDPYNTRATMQLMGVLATGRDPANAVIVGEQHIHRLQAELGVDPDPSLVRLITWLRAPTREDGDQRWARPTLTRGEPSGSTAVGGLAPQRPAEWSRRGSRHVLVGVGTVLVLLLVGALVFGGRIGSDAPLTLGPYRLAVAPFTVEGAGAGLWREGAADVLVWMLDGAGRLGVQRVFGEGGSRSRLGQAQRAGAGLLVRGSIAEPTVALVELDASLIDARTGLVLAQLTVRDSAVKMERALEEMARQILGAIDADRAVGARAPQAMGTASSQALRAFLRGEQFFRRGEWDSAVAAYRLAVQHDADFRAAAARLDLALGSRTVAQRP